MSGTATVIPLRITSKMLADIDRYISRAGGTMTRQDCIAVLIGQALPHAEASYVPPDSVRELRMPMTEFISTSVPFPLAAAVKEFAQAHGISVSAAVRLMVYQALGGAMDGE